MNAIQIPVGNPSKAQLEDLVSRCKQTLEKLRRRAREAELRLPLFIEFAGSPKAGKSTIISIVSHFLKRVGLEVIQPAEGASLRTPVGLRDDWLAFNAWSGCYALQHILIDSSSDPCHEVVLLDRGLFDVCAWMHFLVEHQKRVTDEELKAVTDFFTLDLWRERENLVFVFTADYETSLSRENDGKLITAGGSVMNATTLSALKQSYLSTADRLETKFRKVYHLDSSHDGQGGPSFQQIAFVVAEVIVSLLEHIAKQYVLVTNPPAFEGFVTDPLIVRQTISTILEHEHKFLERDEAERSRDVQQVIPYAVLCDTDGRYFFAKRRSNRPELSGKDTLLVGGHIEQSDWDETTPESVFERCLRREIAEELVGVDVRSIEPLGFINDVRNKVGAHHLAFVHKVQVGGRTRIRRQAPDHEFGRESVQYKTAEEVKQSVANLDPWSQLVAQTLFGTVVPRADTDPTLFTSN